MTVFSLALAYRDRGLGRVAGAAIIAGYLAFVTALLIAVVRRLTAVGQACARRSGASPAAWHRRGCAPFRSRPATWR